MTQIFVVTVGAADGPSTGSGVAHNAPAGVFSTQDKADAYVAQQRAASGATYDWRATGYEVDALPIEAVPGPVEEPAPIEEPKDEPGEGPEAEEEEESERASARRRPPPPPPPPHRGGRR
jgi:hypothetical protein